VLGVAYIAALIFFSAVNIVFAYKKSSGL
jgi:hypothetical protein